MVRAAVGIFDESGFIRSDVDKCLFSKIVGECITHVAVYVDDLLIIAPTITVVNHIKSALNQAQVRDMDAVGSLQRTRRQAALTQFDEAGAIVVLRDAGLLAAWDRHDWPALFLQRRDAWTDGGVRLHVFGHALFEHALNPAMLLVGKCIVLVAANGMSAERIDGQVADAIESRQGLLDPQDLRPLPLAGIPGWHHALQDADFYRDQPCFRPLRPGRVYPPPSSG